MNKKFKVCTFFIILIYIISSLPVGNFVKAESISDNNVNLVTDILDYKESLPKHFRKTTDLSTIRDNKDLNLNGMDKLNISGGQQFSEFNLDSMITAICTYKFL